MARTVDVEHTPVAARLLGADQRSWRTAYADGAAFLGRGMLAGFVCGALVGGVGGRAAMLVLRLTSDDALRGLDTDDGFTIGAITPATIFLVIFAALLGAFGGLVYLAVREWLPPRWRAPVFGLLGATVGGALIINPDGLDFTALGPHWLAVTLFVLLPAIYGGATSLLAERLARSVTWGRGRWRWMAGLPLVLVALTGLPGVVMLLLSGVIIGTTRSERVMRLRCARPVAWIGRTAIVLVVSWSAILLARDVRAVL